MNEYQENWDALGMAVVKQAIVDYEKHKISRDLLKKFLTSDWFQALCPLDGEALLEGIDRNQKLHGRSMPFDDEEQRKKQQWNRMYRERKKNS